MQALYAALVIALLPPQPPQDRMSVDWSHVAGADTEITALRTAYAESVNAGDAARAVSLYTPDALSVYCDGSLVRGADVVAARITDRTQEHAAVTLVPKKFSSTGSVASETGTFVESIPGPTGATSVEGVYVTIYSRVGGQWRIALEVRTTGHRPALMVW